MDGEGCKTGMSTKSDAFNLMTADLEEMAKVKWGAVRLEGNRIYTLAYADDIVLLAEKEGEMKSMIERFERYMSKKGFVVNTEKR